MLQCANFSTFKLFLLLSFGLISMEIQAQSHGIKNNPKSEFWQHVHFGGGIGLNIGSGFTNVSLAPSAIYNFNPYFSAGVGLQGSYVKVRDNYESYIYGGSLIGLFNPTEQVQISAELEQLRVDRNIMPLDFRDNFWNTALFIGAGYRTQNVTVGVRYNVLFKKNDFVYSDALMPFVRIYF